jgi:2-dehydropantoate 2-reductase
MSLLQAPEKARILVVGAGATGGYFGGRLAQASRDVTFLVRPARAAQLRTNGLHIVSPHGDLAIEPQLVQPGAIAAPYDVVLLAVKAYALEAALADFAPAVGSGTAIVPFLNGMRHIALLTERFGEAPVLGGVCVVATTLDGEGRIVQLAGMQEIGYGERDGSASERVAGLDRLMQGAGFVAGSSRTILLDMWSKWVMLASLGGATCLLRGTVGEIEAAGGVAIALAFLDECRSVAAASGYVLGNEFLATAKAWLTAKGSTSASSMYRDLQAGKPVEVDQILGDMVTRAQSFGIAVPLLAAATAQLTIYQQRRAP